eukprot:scaffold1237_cov243-Pinguiococcus_pyrenoidosus.AAC.36
MMVTIVELQNSRSCFGRSVQQKVHARLLEYKYCCRGITPAVSRLLASGRREAEVMRCVPQAAARETVTCLSTERRCISSVVEVVSYLRHRTSREVAAFVAGGLLGARSQPASSVQPSPSGTGAHGA